MAINYYSLQIITNDLSENIFSGVFGVDVTSSHVIKFFNNTNINENILNTDINNSNNADWLFTNNRFSERGTNINNIPLLMLSNAQKFKIYNINNVNYIDFYNGSQWTTISNTYNFTIQYITTTSPPIMRPTMSIDQYCAIKKRHGLTKMDGCITALPLSKKYVFNTIFNTNINTISNNNNNLTQPPRLEIRNRMKYAEYVRIYGGTQKSTSSALRTCLIAGPSFTY
jgi:hypothetical protein